jgi:hypothetical protein
MWRGKKGGSNKRAAANGAGREGRRRKISGRLGPGKRGGAEVARAVDEDELPSLKGADRIREARYAMYALNGVKTLFQNFSKALCIPLIPYHCRH